jgi:uncharacterized protein
VIVLDSVVLAYATGSDHPLREPCRAVIGKVTDGLVRATTTVEVVQEFAHVRSRRRPRSDAVALARSYARLLAPLVVVEAADLDAGLRLFEEVPSLGAFDAVLAAVTRSRGADALVSADRAFAAVPGLRLLDLSSPTFDDELAALV